MADRHDHRHAARDMFQRKPGQRLAPASDSRNCSEKFARMQMPVDP